MLYPDAFPMRGCIIPGWLGILLGVGHTQADPETLTAVLMVHD